jgi:CRP-like cAMP-binding protein
MASHCLTKGLDMSTIDPRDEHMFPKLTPQELDRLRRFGEVRRFAPGEALFVTGDIAPGMYVLIKGSVRVTTGSVGARRADRGAGTG